MFDDITYYDGEYYEGKYHTVIKPSSVELLGDYIEEGYITDDYFQEEPPAVFSLEASPISYQSKWVDTNRPIEWSFVKSSGADYSFDTTTVKYGSYSLKLPGDSGYRYVKSDLLFPTSIVPSNVEDYIIEFWFYWNDTDADNNHLFSMGNNAWLANSLNITSLDNTDILIYQNGTRRLSATIRVWNNYPTSDTSLVLGGGLTQQWTNNAWNKVALQYTASTKTFRLTINNTEIDARSLSATQVPHRLHTDTRFWLYEDNFSADDKYIDNFRFTYGSNTIGSNVTEHAGSIDDIVFTKFENNFDDSLGIILDIDETLASTTSLSVAASTAVGGIVDLDATFTISSSSTVLTGGIADIGTSVSISAEANKVQNAVATINSSTTTSATGVKIVSADSSNDSSFAITTDNTRILFGESDFDSIGSVVAAVGKVGDFFANVDIQTSLTADAAITIEGAATIDSSFATQSVSQRNRTADSTIATTTTIANTARRLRTAATQLDSNASISASAFNLKQFGADFEVDFGTTATGNVLTDAILNLNIQAGFTGQGAKLVSADANINTITSISIKGFIVNLVQYVYYIPVETRVNTISSETRSHSVRPETRAHSVDIETRSQTIRTEDRIHEVKGT